MIQKCSKNKKTYITNLLAVVATAGVVVNADVVVKIVGITLPVE